MNAGGAAADERVNIGLRPVPQELMAHAPSFAHPGCHVSAWRF